MRSGIPKKRSGVEINLPDADVLSSGIWNWTVQSIVRLQQFYFSVVNFGMIIKAKRSKSIDLPEISVKVREL